LKEVVLLILKVGDSFCKREVVLSAADQQNSSSSWCGSVLLIKELIKVVACSGLLTLPVVVINKGSCKTLGCWQRRSEREPWLCFA